GIATADQLAGHENEDEAAHVTILLFMRIGRGALQTACCENAARARASKRGIVNGAIATVWSAGDRAGPQSCRRVDSLGAPTTLAPIPTGARPREALDALHPGCGVRRRGAVFFHDHRAGQGAVPRVHGVPRADQLRRGRRADRADRPGGGAEHRVRSHRQWDGRADRVWPHAASLGAMSATLKKNVEQRRDAQASRNDVQWVRRRLRVTVVRDAFARRLWCPYHWSVSDLSLPRTPIPTN